MALDCLHYLCDNENYGFDSKLGHSKTVEVVKCPILQSLPPLAMQCVSNRIGAFAFLSVTLKTPEFDTKLGRFMIASQYPPPLRASTLSRLFYRTQNNGFDAKVGSFMIARI